MRARKDAAGQALPFSNQPQEEMLGLNRNAPELAGFVTGEEKYSSCPFGVPFEHPGTYVKVEGVGVTESMTTLYGIARFAILRVLAPSS